MALHLDPDAQSLVNQQENESQQSTDQRIFPRIKIVKAIKLSVGLGDYAGEMYDIGQGGLGFIVAETIDLGPASIRIANSDYVFDGKILASHKFGAAEALHFHFQFDKPIDRATLAVVLGI
ncbi:MAG: PilZ domain-containing protein [Turneriella sp.]